MDQSRKPMEEDYLKWVYLLSTELFNSKYYRRARIFTFVTQLFLLIANIYFFVKEFETAFLTRYIAIFLALIASFIFNICFLISEEGFHRLELEIKPTFWSTDSTTKEVETKILKESKYVTYAVVLNSFLGVVCGLLLIPFGKEQEYYFPLFFSKTYLGNFRYIFDFFYFLEFPVSSYTLVNMANVIAYYAYHAKAQINLCLEVISQLSAGYEDKDDDVLLNSNEYQNVIEKRTRFIVIRHNELLRYARIATNLAGNLLPWVTLGGVTMAFSSISYIYFVAVDSGYWKYFQTLVWTVTQVLNFALLVQCGQEIESQTSVMFSVINQIRWISFNKKNKMTILTILTVGQVPSKLKFTDNVSVNYQLGLRVVRNVYSIAAIFAKVKSR